MHDAADDGEDADDRNNDRYYGGECDCVDAGTDDADDDDDDDDDDGGDDEMIMTMMC